MILCQRCGYENPDSTTNCAQCHINLQFAHENIEQFRTQWQAERELAAHGEQRGQRIDNLLVTTTPAIHMRDVIEFTIRIALLAFMWVIWSWASKAPFSNAMNLSAIVGGPLLVFPLVWLGRKILDRHQTTGCVAWTTTFVQFAVAILLGAAIIRAAITHRDWSGWVLPVPAEIGLLLVVITGAAFLLTVGNLALKGFGAPFFIALSQKLAADWLYAWTRNPMVLAVLTFLLSLGIWFQSALFMLWVLILYAPALLFFVKVYEERELEFRFGASYREYKSRTPMLFPRRPRERSGARS